MWAEEETTGRTAEWLAGWSQGRPEDRDRLFEHLYPELRRLAASCLAASYRARPRHQEPYQATELIHELYLQMLRQRRVEWQSRQHFFAIASRLLRRLMIDEGRRRQCEKRGGGKPVAPLEAAGPVAADSSPAPVDLLALDRALDRLEAIDERAVRVVELRFLAGLSHDETASALGVSRATVGRSWRFARAWLRDRLAGPSS
ncbi:MAG: ECF-type sigma factor [Acidobacteriota bacterium]|nr:ECF-type sigma factor [Acidobacteriota bacterium]